MVYEQPKFIVTFKELAVTAIRRNARGKVIIVLDDDTTGFLDNKSYRTLGEIDKDTMTARNYLLCQLAFLNNPKEVVLMQTEEDFQDLQNKFLQHNNYTLVMPYATGADYISAKSFIHAQREVNDYSQAIFANATSPDAEYIINLCTANANDTFDCDMGEETLTQFTAKEFTCFVAGALSGLPSSRSLTYFKIPVLANVPLFADEDGAVALGKLIVIKRDGEYKFGRAVNSLVTLTDGVTEAFQKIRIINSRNLAWILHSKENS